MAVLAVHELVEVAVSQEMSLLPPPGKQSPRVKLPLLLLTLLLMSTVPAGTLAPLAAVSVTVAVQFVPKLIKTGFGVHDTVVLVVCA